MYKFSRIERIQVEKPVQENAGLHFITVFLNGRKKELRGVLHCLLLYLFLGDQVSLENGGIR